MDTSRSDESAAAFVAEALLFSGRQNPVWNVDSRVGRQLEALWESLESCSGTLPQAPALGYRGCVLRYIPDCSWHVCLGVVVCERDRVKELRKDSRREFEKLLLSTAPPGVLPPSFLPRDVTD